MYVATGIPRRLHTAWMRGQSACLLLSTVGTPALLSSHRTEGGSPEHTSHNQAQNTLITSKIDQPHLDTLCPMQQTLSVVKCIRWDDTVSFFSLIIGNLFVLFNLGLCPNFVVTVRESPFSKVPQRAVIMGMGVATWTHPEVSVTAHVTCLLKATSLRPYNVMMQCSQGAVL